MAAGWTPWAERQLKDSLLGVSSLQQSKPCTKASLDYQQDSHGRNFPESLHEGAVPHQPVSQRQVTPCSPTPAKPSQPLSRQQHQALHLQALYRPNFLEGLAQKDRNHYELPKLELAAPHQVPGSGAMMETEKLLSSLPGQSHLDTWAPKMASLFISTYLATDVTMYLLIFVSIYPSIYLSVYLSTCPSIHPSIHLSVHLSFY